MNEKSRATKLQMIRDNRGRFTKESRKIDGYPTFSDQELITIYRLDHIKRRLVLHDIGFFLLGLATAIIWSLMRSLVI